MRTEDQLVKLDARTEMEISADVLVRLMAAGVALDPAELERLGDAVRRRTELALIRRWLVADVRAGVVPQVVIGMFDRFAESECARFPLPEILPPEPA